MENIGLPSDNCPTAPPSQVTVYTRVLHRACQIVGDVEPLAARLRVPVPTLFRWLDGDAEPPTPVFLKAVISSCRPGAPTTRFSRALRATRKKPLA